MGVGRGVRLLGALLGALRVLGVGDRPAESLHELRRRVIVAQMIGAGSPNSSSRTGPSGRSLGSVVTIILAMESP